MHMHIRLHYVNVLCCVEQLEIKVVLNPQRIDKKLQEQAEKLNWNGINFPLAGKISINLKRITRRFP